MPWGPDVGGDVSALQVAIAVAGGAGLTLGGFIIWVWYEWCYRPARVWMKAARKP
jgi:hypothetical protein